MTSNDKNTDEACPTEMLDQMSELVLRIRSLEKFNSQLGVRLRMSTMEAAAENAAFEFLRKKLSPTRYMPSVGGWSVQYQVIAALVDYILNTQVEQPLIAELGSGVSTSWIALALKVRGSGELLSVEHDPFYAAQTRYALEKLALSSQVQLIEAGLTPTGEALEERTWYDPSCFDASLRERPIDILLVDGPPGNIGLKSRLPAFPILASRLNDEALIVLDDTDRSEEKEIIDDWKLICSELNENSSLNVIESVGRSTFMQFSRKYPIKF